VSRISLLEYLEDEKSSYAEWFSGLDAVPAARIDRYVPRDIRKAIDRWTTYKKRKRKR
jgi:hypothetical protein